MEKENNLKLVAAGLIAAIGASLCCITPILALVAGIGGVASAFAWLDPFRPYLIGLTSIVLAFAWFQKVKASKKSADCACNDTQDHTSFFQSSKFLAVTTILAIGLLSFPSYSHLLLPTTSMVGSPAVEQGLIHHVELSIEGMTCEGCEASVNHLLGNKEGVIKAISSYEKGNAKVRYDPAIVSPEIFKKAIEEEIGYKVTHIEITTPEHTTTQDPK